MAMGREEEKVISNKNNKTITRLFVPKNNIDSFLITFLIKFQLSFYRNCLGRIKNIRGVTLPYGGHFHICHTSKAIIKLMMPLNRQSWKCSTKYLPNTCKL